MTIIMAYQTCDDHIERADARSTWRQQWEVLQDKGDKDQNPRQQFWTDINQEIKAYKDKKHEVLLMLDANDHEATELDPIMQKLDMKDVHVYQHRPDSMPETYNRGSHRIDFTYATTGLLPYISKSGYGAYDEICRTDHRHVFLDIDLTRFLGGAAPQITPREARILATSNPRYVYKYRQVLAELEKQHRLLERWEEVTKRIEQQGTTTELEEELEDLDTITTNCRLEAERQCGKLSKLAWSPPLRDARRRKKYWEAWQNEYRLARDYSQKRQKLLSSFKTPPPMPTPEEIPRKIRQAQKELQEVRDKAKQYREEFLQERAYYYSTLCNCTREQAIKAIKSAEETKRAFEHLQQMKQKKPSGALKFVLVRKADNPEEHVGIFDPEEVNKTISTRNQHHFSQAEGTPFTIEPLRTLLGRHGDTKMARDIEQGNTPQLDMTEAAQAILNQLATQRLPEIDVHITAEQLRKGYNKWRESTATSPSGVHLGHYRALSHLEPNIRKEEEEHHKTNIGEKFMEIEALKSNIALQHGYVYKRWETVISLMLEKIAGVPKIEKLRVIHLFEADINILFGIIWSKRLVRHGENHGVHGEEQWARPGRNCEEVLLLKELTYMLLELTRTPGGTFDNDAKACYDRIVMVLAALRCKQLGIPNEACKMMTRFLEQAKYFVKTMSGVATEGYTSTPER